jgi:hypothetical protein
MADREALEKIGRIRDHARDLVAQVDKEMRDLEASKRQARGALAEVVRGHEEAKTLVRDLGKMASEDAALTKRLASVCTRVEGRIAEVFRLMFGGTPSPSMHTPGVLPLKNVPAPDQMQLEASGIDQRIREAADTAAPAVLPGDQVRWEREAALLKSYDQLREEAAVRIELEQSQEVDDRAKVLQPGQRGERKDKEVTQ